MRVLVMNGPNLNRLGARDPSVYGRSSLAEVMGSLAEVASTMDGEIEALQSNHEGALIDWLQDHQTGASGLILNPGGLTASGDALRDAVVDSGLQLAVVHISNFHARPEPWRRRDLFVRVASLYIAGMGTRGYEAALRVLLERTPGHDESGARGNE